MKRDLSRMAAALTAAFLMLYPSVTHFYADESTENAGSAETVSAEVPQTVPPPLEPPVPEQPETAESSDMSGTDETEVTSVPETPEPDTDSESASFSIPVSMGMQYEADVSSAVISKNWGQSFVLLKSDFDAARITANSQVIVDYAINPAEIPPEKLDANGELTEAPIELIVQSWSETNTAILNSTGSIWARVAPVSYNKKQAIFNYADIVAAYGISDFSCVDALNIGDTDIASMKCKGMVITNVLPPVVTHSEGTDLNELIDISSAVPSNGYNEVFRLDSDKFDFTKITADTKITVRYNMSQYSSSCPIAMLIESEKNTTSPKAVNDGKFNVNVLSESFDTQEAVFSCQGIVRAYGTGDFSQIDTLVFAGNGNNFVLTSIEISDLLPEGLRSKLPDSQISDDISDTSTGEAEEDMTTMIIVSSVIVVVLGTLAAVIIILKNR